MDTLYILPFLNALKLTYRRQHFLEIRNKLGEKYIHMTKNQQNPHTAETSIQGKEELEGNTPAEQLQNYYIPIKHKKPIYINT
jgi:hypothetical protein